MDGVREMEDMSPAAAAAAACRGRAAYLHDYLAAPHEPPRTPPTLEFTYLGHAGASSGDLQDYLAAAHEPPPPHHPALPLEFTYLGHAGANSTNRRDAASGAGDLRMIRHRASAARSRARQHAYTKELERELAQLRRDNHMLIKRQQDLHARLALPAQVSTLRRCRSAPPAP